MQGVNFVECVRQRAGRFLKTKNLTETQTDRGGDKRRNMEKTRSEKGQSEIMETLDLDSDLSRKAQSLYGEKIACHLVRRKQGRSAKKQVGVE